MLGPCWMQISSQDQRHNWLAIEAFILLAILVITLYLLLWDDRLKSQEHIQKCKRVLKKLQSCIADGSWPQSSFLSLHMPLSPCVTLQWTARDGHLCNLPCGLIVAGDVIYLRPGQIVVVDCKELTCDSEVGSKQYRAGEVYNPETEARDSNTKSDTGPQSRSPWKPKPFIVLETPFTKNIRMFLRQAQLRPCSVLNNDRYQVYTVWIERKILILIFAVTLLANVLRYMFLADSLGHWGEVCLSLQVQAILPLSALFYPLIWRFLDMFGIARMLSTFYKSIHCKTTSGFDSSNILNEASNLSLDSKDVWKYFQEILSGGCDALPRTSNLLHGLGNVTSFCCVDKKGVLSWPNPTAEKVFFLTSNPVENSQRTSHSSGESNKTTKSSLINECEVRGKDEGNEGVFCEDQFETSSPLKCTKSCPDYTQNTSFQVLDLTQDPDNPFSLNFDDPSWKKYIRSLKPLGLNILLNACNVDTSERYTQFADHVTCASLEHEVAIPVVNKSVITVEALSTVRRRNNIASWKKGTCRCFRMALQEKIQSPMKLKMGSALLGHQCFCELAHKIGFNSSAVDIFSCQQILGMYRHMPSDHLPKDRLAKSSFIKYKMPMPHMFSVVVKENTTGSCQLFSQGTADLLLDVCSEFWDGEDLKPLSDLERKKVFDFYHRTSMSSYCTAFSYRPMTRKLGLEFNNIYIEVPDDASDLHPSIWCPMPARSWDTQSLEGPLGPGYEYLHSSLDSLIMDTSNSSVHDVPGCVRELCNQIFIGMITMQYQAKNDIVDLIENLESACIRFVHFSKENELRSRVFSEKMGLEAGWNCHVSLLSGSLQEPGERSLSHPDMSQSSNSNRASRYSSRHSTDSYPFNKSNRDDILFKIKANGASSRMRHSSAPGAINLDMATVKFDTTPSPHRDLSRQDSPESAQLIDIQLREEHSVDNHHDMESKQMFKENLANIKEIPSDPTEPLLSDTKASQEHDEQTDSMDVDGGETALHQPQAGMSMDSLPASSFVTENTDSVAGGLGLSNRAKLPKGVENIRPHLENVDNVPLLVSLFTDCTPSTTREMLSILQEYGEVVCCLGSSANIHNTGVLMQADCSLAVEPLYTQTCMKADLLRSPWNASLLGPMELSALLHSLPCALAFSRDDNIAIIKLIALARHHCQQMRHMFLFFLMCEVTISLLHTLDSLVLLPPILSPHLTLWLAGIVTPLLSLTLMGNPLDLQIVKMAQGKNHHHISGHGIFEFVKYYVFRYVPTIFVCIICHSLTLYSLCNKVTQDSSMLSHNNTLHNSSCHFLFGDISYHTSGHWNGWYGDYYPGLVISQNITACLLVLYFLCGSLCFVLRLKQLWQKNPFTNKVWCIVAPIMLIVQVLYFTLDLAVTKKHYPSSLSLHDVPIATWVLGLAWILVLIPMHELVKRKEAKGWQRYQKRARLDFGTKLGMNSPF